MIQYKIKHIAYIILVLVILFPLNAWSESYLQWTAPDGEVLGYRIYYGILPGELTDSIDVGNVTSYPLSSLSLKPDTTYHFVVRAYNSFGESDDSIVITWTMGDSTPPMTPQGLTATVDGNNVNLSWTANSDTDLSGYRIYKGTSSRVYDLPVAIENVTNYVVSDLKSGTTYYFAITALDSSGNESGLSNESVATIASALANECKMSGSESFYWNGESAVFSNGCGLGAIKVGTLTGVLLESTAKDYSSGTGKSLFLNEINENLEFANDNLFNSSEGKLELHIFPLNHTESGTLFEAVNNGLNTFHVHYAKNGKIYAYHRGNGGLLNVGFSSNYIKDNQWNEVIVKWSVKDSKLETCVNGTCSTNNADLQAFSQEPGTICIGENLTSSTSYEGYIDEVKIYSSSSDTPVITVDTVSPNLKISTPIESGVYETSDKTVTLTGVASDDTKVSEITWTNSKGGSGNAVGTDTWTVSNLPLFDGDNIITVTAQDPAGNKTENKITVSYVAPCSTLGNANLLWTGEIANKPLEACSSAGILDGVSNGSIEIKAFDHTTGTGKSVYINGPGESLQFGNNGLWSSAEGQVDLYFYPLNHDTGGVFFEASVDGLNKFYLRYGTNGKIYVTHRGNAGVENLAASTSTIKDNQWNKVTVSWSQKESKIETCIDGNCNSTNATINSFSSDPSDINIGERLTRVTSVNAYIDDVTIYPTATISTTAPADTSIPELTIVSPASSGVYDTQDSAVTLSGTAKDNVGVTKVSWRISDTINGVATGTDNWSISGIALSEGDNLISVTAEDAAGNKVEKTLTVSYTIPDTVAPEVAILQPTDKVNYATQDSNLSLSGTATDNKGVTTVTWLSSRGDSGTATGTATWTIPGITLVEGDTTFIVTASDEANNKGTAAVKVTYTPPDLTAPSISIENPSAAGSYDTKNSSISISGIASDNRSVSKVTWSATNGQSGVASGTDSWTIAGISLSDGENIFSIKAFDEAGNSSEGKITIRYINPCSALGSANLYWGGENSAFETACISSGTKNGRIIGPIESSDKDHTTGSGRSIKINNINESLEFDNSGIWNSSGGRVELYVYPLNHDNFGTIFEAYADNGNKFYFKYSKNAKIYAYFRSNNGTMNTAFSSARLTDNQWNQVIVSWSASTSSIDICVNGSCSGKNLDISPFSAEPSVINIGGKITSDAPFEGYIDDVKISK